MFNIYIPTTPRTFGGLKNSIDSLRLAGFNQKINVIANPESDKLFLSDVHFYFNKEKYGLSQNWKVMIEMALQENEPWMMIVEDDVECHRRAAEHINNCILRIEKPIGFISGYTPEAYLWPWKWLDKYKGWAKINRGQDTWGTQCILLQKESARLVLESDQLLVRPIDVHIGSLFKELNRDCFYPVPSLFEHLGLKQSSIHGDEFHPMNCGLLYGKEFIENKGLLL